MQTVSFQLYSARNFPPLADVLKTVGAAGYTQVEGYGALYAALDDAALVALKADMDKSGVTMPSAHFGLDLLESDPARAVHIAQTLGIQSIYCPSSRCRPAAGRCERLEGFWGAAGKGRATLPGRRSRFRLAQS